MKLEDLTEGNIRDVMVLWKKHLGFWYGESIYLRHPDILTEAIKDTSSWAGSRFEDRIGSRFTDDSKLLVNYVFGNIEISCYAQAHTVFNPRNRKLAEKAEAEFNNAIKDYLAMPDKT